MLAPGWLMSVKAGYYPSQVRMPHQHDMHIMYCTLDFSYTIMSIHNVRRSKHHVSALRCQEKNHGNWCPLGCKQLTTNFSKEVLGGGTDNNIVFVHSPTPTKLDVRRSIASGLNGAKNFSSSKQKRKASMLVICGTGPSCCAAS